MKTILLMSRGQRLGALYSSIARDLARDHRVVALIDDSERAFWAGLDNVEAFTLAEAEARSVAPDETDQAALVSRIERETGLTLYQAARNYLLYGRLHSELFGWRNRRWLWPDEAAIAADYVRAWRGIGWLLETYQPSLVLLEAPDHVYAALAQVMAAKRGVLALGIYFAPLAGDCSMFFYTGFQPHNVLQRYYYAKPEAIPEDAWARARSMIDKVRSEGPPQIAYVTSMRERSREILKPMLRKAARAATDPAEWARFSPSALRGRQRTLAKEMWLQKTLRSDIPEGPFVLFFLQHQPEASLATQAPHLVDQGLMIEQIAVNAPAGWKIVVKEHPRTYPARGEAFFRPLMDLPNVHLCAPSVASSDLMKRAEVVLALTGSVGMEGILAGKRVAAVGRPYYAFYPGLARLDRPGDLFDAIAGLDARAADDPDLVRFAAAYYASVFDAGTLGPDRMWPLPEEAGPRMGAQLRRHVALVEAGELRVADYPLNQR